MWWKRVTERFVLSGCGTLYGLYRCTREIILRLDIRTVDFNHFYCAAELLIFHSKLGLNRFTLMTIDNVQHQRAVVVGSRGVQLRYIVESPAFVFGHIHYKLKSFALCVVGEKLERVIDGLQKEALFIGENGCDDIHQLRQVRDFDNVSMVHEGVEESGDNEGIF